MSITINVYESPLDSGLQSSLVALGLKNSFGLDVHALNLPGNYYAIAEKEGLVVAMRRFKRHVLKSRSGESIHALQACDTLTDVNARGLGLFSKLWGELKISVMADYTCTFNFPNDISYPIYIKDGFKTVNRIVTCLLRNPPKVLIETEEIYFDYVESESDQSTWLRHKLRHGLHNKFPLYSVSGQNICESDGVKNALPRFYSLSGNHLVDVHDMSFIKAVLFSSRPVTYFGFDKEFDATTIYLNAACYDTAIK